MQNIFKPLIHELKHHLPFTGIATAIAIVFALTFSELTIDINETIFDSLHLTHLLASSIVTAGIFYKYKKNVLYALIVGILGSLVIGSLSDIIFPWLGASIFQLNPHFHLPLLEIPPIVLLISGIGSLIGILTLRTKIPHTLHVGISVFASLFYLITYTSGISIMFLILSFLIILVSVIIPCCVSDILFPFFFLKKKIKHCNC